MHPRCGPNKRAPKLNEEQLTILEQIVKANNDATLDELRYQLEQKTGVLIGRSTVDRMLTKLNLTVKKKHSTLRKRRANGCNSNAREFWQLMQSVLALDLIFIDESGINLALTRLFARSPQGQRARGVRPQKRGKNVSLIGAIGFNGLIAQVSLLGSTDGLTFEAFIAQRLVPLVVVRGLCADG